MSISSNLPNLTTNQLNQATQLDVKNKMKEVGGEYGIAKKTLESTKGSYAGRIVSDITAEGEKSKIITKMAEAMNEPLKTVKETQIEINRLSSAITNNKQIADKEKGFLGLSAHFLNPSEKAEIEKAKNAIILDQAELKKQQGIFTNASQKLQEISAKSNQLMKALEATREGAIDKRETNDEKIAETPKGRIEEPRNVHFQGHIMTRQKAQVPSSSLSPTEPPSPTSVSSATNSNEAPKALSAELTPKERKAFQREVSSVAETKQTRIGKRTKLCDYANQFSTTGTQSADPKGVQKAIYCYQLASLLGSERANKELKKLTEEQRFEVPPREKLEADKDVQAFLNTIPP